MKLKPQNYDENQKLKLWQNSTCDRFMKNTKKYKINYLIVILSKYISTQLSGRDILTHRYTWTHRYTFICAYRQKGPREPVSVVGLMLEFGLAIFTKYCRKNCIQVFGFQMPIVLVELRAAFNSRSMIFRSIGPLGRCFL